jgi:hypothetical protein
VIDVPGNLCQGHAVRPLAPVRSTERPAGEVIPANRQELAGGHPAGDGPDEHRDADALPHLADGREEMKHSPRALQPKF